MARYWIKLVPDAEPNADGTWIDIDCNPLEGKNFTEAAESIVSDFAVPDGFHIVSVEWVAE